MNPRTRPPLAIAGAIDREGRCRHWDGTGDVLAIRLPCCTPFWACHACHAETADHAARPWPSEDFGAMALACGACGSRSTIAAYLRDPTSCAACRHPFNPGCRRHHHLYFAPG